MVTFLFPTLKSVFALLLLLSINCNTYSREEIGSSPNFEGRPAPERATGYLSKAPVVSRHSMIVAAHPQAVRAGQWVLNQGGNALDASIAVQMVLNLVEPQSSGIGGGGFMLFYDASNKRLHTFDGRETAPAGALPDMFMDENGQPVKFYQAVVGGKSVAVPGLLRMLEMAHRQHGKLRWSLLFQPAIELAEKGFPVSYRLHELLRQERFLAQSEPARTYFYNSDGSPKNEGEKIRNPQFARLLKQVARQGADAFYHGEVAKDIVAAVQSHSNHPGSLSITDLADYQAKTRNAVCAPYRAFKICGVPPPSSGGVTLLQMLGILEQFNMAALEPNSVEAVHLISEAGKIAYADRNHYLADPDFVQVPTFSLLEPAYLKQRAETLNFHRSLGKALPGLLSDDGSADFGTGEAIEFPSTTHISIVDSEGNAVSMTSTIENAFGSRIMVHGFLLNNEMTDFSFVPEKNGIPVANRIAPGKRPRSSMAPTIAFDRQGNVRIIIGSPGGAPIINYVAKTLIGVIDWEMDIQEAVSLPNFGSQNGPTLLEKGTVLEAHALSLKALGHEVQLSEMNSGLHGITRFPFHWVGGADPRREGVARGAGVSADGLGGQKPQLGCTSETLVMPKNAPKGTVPLADHEKSLCNFTVPAGR